MKVVILVVAALLLCKFTWINCQEDSDIQLQYKNIVVGVTIDPTNMSLPDDTRDMISTKMLSLVRLLQTHSSDQDNENETKRFFEPKGNETSRTSIISVVEISSIHSSFENIPEISVFMSVMDCEDTYYINKRLVERYGPVIHIAFTGAGCPRLDSWSSIVIPLTWEEPNADLYQLLIDMRSDRVFPGWREVVIINDKQIDDGIITAVGRGLAPNPYFEDITQTIFNVDSMSSKISFIDQVRDVLNMYLKSSATNFLTVVNSENVNRVLEVARNNGYLSILKQWVFFTPDPTSFFAWDFVQNRIIDDGVNVAFIMNSSSKASKSHSDILCNTEKILTQLSDIVEELASWEVDLFYQVSNEEWEIIRPSREDRVYNITKSLQMKLKSDILSSCDKNSSTWIMRAAEYGKIGKQVFDVGWWNPLTGIQMRDDLLPHVTGGFRGRKINVASMHFPPWQVITRSNNDTKVTYSGLMFEVINHMAKDLNFTYNVLEPREGEFWGTIQSDGSWSGMMKMIVEKKAVLSAAAFTVTPERSRYINFTQVIERESYGFMVRRPEELSRVLLFAAPFQNDVWICIFVTVVLIAPILNIIHCFSYYYKAFKIINDKGLFKIKNCYWYIYGSLLQQGGIHLPQAISGRMLIGFWWLFVIVTVTTYSGSLVAFLTFPKVESPVNTVEDLTHFRGVNSWGFLAGSVISEHLETSTEPEFQVLYKKARKHEKFDDKVLKMVRNNQHAYIDWKIVLLTALRDTLKETGKCEYIIAAETFFEEKIALAVPRDSPYLVLFDKQVSQILQTGLLKKWKSRYWPQKNKCTKLTIAAGNRKVGLGDMQGSFYLLFMGLVISASVFIVEFIIYKNRKAKMIDSLKMLVVNEKTTNFWQQKQFPFLH